MMYKIYSYIFIISLKSSYIINIRKTQPTQMFSCVMMIPRMNYCVERILFSNDTIAYHFSFELDIGERERDN